MFLWNNGEDDKAVEVLNKALKMKGDFPERAEAKKLLEEIQTART